MSDLSKTLGSFLQPNADRDILAELLADRRSPGTRRAYAADLKQFFRAIAPHAELTPYLVREFLQLERADALSLVLGYKAKLLAIELAEATINRRLSAIKSLARYAQKVDKCGWNLEQIEGERVQAYRDTSGIDLASFKLMMEVPNLDTVKGKRDYALLRLLWENALRRAEICQANVADFNPAAKTLAILGKGKGMQKVSVSLSLKCVQSIEQWLSVRGECSDSDPLFVAVDHSSYGRRLTGDGLYKIVKAIAEAAGITKRMSPHRCRHSAITEALNATGGDVRQVQKLSRHSKIETLMRYDDNRENMQGKVTDILSDLL